ncbi:hypothetical protein ACFC0K_36195 [Streptomyces hydrogenans]|uniref:hypothetical protein n=1 Tax=Streptomyces hydrogenans TaxID=1873719 RepID=UPI0035E249FE
MYDLHQLSDATSQITGEGLRTARHRLAAADRYDRLIPSADVAQALLEAVILTVLGAGGSPHRALPFGIREAHPVPRQDKRHGSGLELRVEHPADIHALLGHLPYQSRRGPWRGTRGLMVQTVGRSLQFGLRDWSYERRWDTAEPRVTVALPCEGDLPALLAAHTEQILAQAGTPAWDAAVPEPGPKRTEPSSRSLLRRLSPVSVLGSALLRRPRLWDRLAGHAGITASGQTVEDGTEWIVDRTVNGDSYDEERLIALLTDRVVGCGLDLIDHTCAPEECTLRLSPGPTPRRGSPSRLVVRSRRVPTPSTASTAPKPTIAIGEQRATARPEYRLRPSPAPGVRDGRVILLITAAQFGGPRSHLGREDLARTAEQLAAVWAAQGRYTALLRLPRDELLSMTSPWPSAAPPLPAVSPVWRPLRLTPAPGGLWSGEAAPGDAGLAVAVSDARRRFDCTLLVSKNWEPAIHTLGELADFTLLLHPASPYPREITIAATRPSAKTISLTASEAATQWRTEELGRWRQPVTGLLLQTGFQDDERPLDDFDREIEENLARFGTPVIGRYPYSGHAVHGPGLSDHPPTVLDPETSELPHARMIRAADELREQLGLFPSELPRCESGATTDMS